jgi:O-antigen/teichoic acid export membrane protein
MGTKKTFFKNAAVFSGYNYISWFFESLVSTVILSRFLTPKEYGFVALITIFSGFITLFANTGISYSIIRSNYGPTFQRIIFNLTTWIGMFLSLAMCLLAYPITLIYGNPDLFWPTIVIALQFITNSLNIVPLAILEKRLDFKYTGMIGLVSVIFTITLMTIMAIFGFTYWSLIVPMVVQPLFRHILIERRAKFGFHLYGWKKTKLGLRKIKSMLASFTIFNFINYFARNTDSFSVGKFYGEVNLGLYNRAYNFINLGKKVVNVSLGKLLLPSLINAKAKGEDIRPYFLDILGMLNLINLLIAVPLVLFAKPIVLILWGVDWIGVADFLPYIGAIIPMQTLSIAVMDLYVIESKERYLVTLEIPLTFTMIAGIIVGAFFSPLHILRFYALSFILVQTPLSLYYSHYKLFKFTSKQIFKFWVPKMLLTAALIFSIWFGNIYITSFLMAAFVFDTVYFRFNDIKNIVITIKEKLKELKAKKRTGS